MSVEYISVYKKHIVLGIAIYSPPALSSMVLRENDVRKSDGVRSG